MPGIIIPDEAKEILSYIQEMGGITDKQIDLLLGKKAAGKQYYLGTLRVKYIREENGIYFTKSQKAVLDPIVETCGWVILENYHDSDGKPVFLKRDSDPVVATFMKNEVVYHVVYVDRNRKASISLLERLYFDVVNPGGEKDVPDEYVFVIDKIDYLDIFENLEIHMPHKVAFVNKANLSAEGRPNVEYYG